jgi:TFIIF-interacting CTD phosphatase-like protein
VKDLALLDRDLSRVVYIDSKPMSYWMYPDNCYPIGEFKADQTMEDEDLNGVILEIENFKKLQDIRPTFIQRYKTRELLK